MKEEIELRAESLKSEIDAICQQMIGDLIVRKEFYLR